MAKKIKKIINSGLLTMSLILAVFPMEIKAENVEKLSQVAVPVVHSRSSWSNTKDDKRSKNVWPAEHKNPVVIIVHHTATSYKSSTIKQIKKIYKYHSYTKKWGDIGYNYIIGEDGLIFQGRYGNNGVIGGHAYDSSKKINYNSGSIGIAILGNYESKKISSVAQDSLEKLIGWLAANNGISVKSGIDFHGKSLNNSVIGHQDVASTDCPGKNIYGELSSIGDTSQSLSSSYENYAYKISGKSEIYEIIDGKRYSGSAKDSIATISEDQLEAYPSGGAIENGSEGQTYPSGTLVEVSAERKRGILESGVLREINGDSLSLSSYNESNFVEISSEKWASFSTGAAAEFRNGAFVKDLSGNYYVFFENKKRRLNFSSEDLKLISLSAAHDISGSESAQYAEGEAINETNNFPEGTIITSDYKKYFYVSGNGVKKEISKTVFRATFSQEMAVKVSAKLLKEYKTKGDLPFRSGAVVGYRGDNYFIENGSRLKFSKKSLVKEMGYGNIQNAKRTDMRGIGTGEEIK